MQRRGAHDGEGEIVDQDRLIDGPRGRSETALAQSEADDGDRGRAGPIVIGHDQASGRRRNAEALEIIAGDVFGVGDLRLVADPQVKISRALISENAGKDGFIPGEHLHCRIG